MADDTNPQADPIVREALARVKLLLEIEGPQRKREMEDLAAQLPENLWDEAAKKARQGALVGGIAVQARPMISIPKLDQPISSVLNQEKAAHLGVNVHPISEDADDDTAEVQQDLYRMIERHSRAGLARTWAFDRAVKSGRGAYRVLTVWDDESDDPSDQKIIIKRLLRQEMAFFDTLWSEEPDFCDARWGGVGAWLPFDVYKALYGSSELAKYSDDDFSSLMSETSEAGEPLWVRGDTETRAVFVMEYYRRVVTYDDAPLGNGKTRKREQSKIEWYKLNAREVLDKEDVNGRYIPLIPAIGRELQPFDQERRWIGMVRPARDAAKLFNAAASNALEMASTEPKAPVVMYEGQQEGHEAVLQEMNVRNFAYVLVKPTVDAATGQVLPLPQRMQVDTSRMSPSLLLLEKAEQFIQAATSNTDPTMLERLANKRVAKETIAGLQDQGDFGKSDFLHNLAEVSLAYEAKVVLDLMPAIYDRPGRVVRLLTGENKPRTVMLNQQFYIDPKTKRPRAIQGQPPQDAKVLNYDLRKGRYTTSVEVGKSWKTRVAEGSDRLGEIIAKEPQTLPILGPLWFQYQDFPGAKEATELLKKMRAMQFPGLDADPEDSAQQLEAAKGRMQALQQQLQQAMQYIQNEQAKHEAQIQIEHIKAETQKQLQAMKDATSIAVAEINAETKGVIHADEAQQKALALGLEHRHEVEMAQLGHSQAMASAGLEGVTAADAAEREHAHGMEAQQAEQEFGAAENERERQAAAAQADADRQAAAQQASEANP